jgi:hypothetical protein
VLNVEGFSGYLVGPLIRERLPAVVQTLELQP